MSTLYISDLDGTLLGNDQRVSENSARMLREAASLGARFTYATARTAASAVKITDNIGVNVPCVLMNGVTVYDMNERRYVRNEYLPREASEAAAKLLDRLGQSGFMYKISGNKLSCEYTALTNPAMTEFYETRRKRYDKPFERIESFSSSCSDDVIYFCLLDTLERLEPVRAAVAEMKGLKYEFYRDIYNNNVYYLEIFSERASKRSGVSLLRRMYGFDRVVCFGDNLNDLPMFDAAEHRVAVGNAKPELKEAADEVIGDNTADSVAEYILRCARYEKSIQTERNKIK